MKLSTLIKQAQAILESQGDMDVIASDEKSSFERDVKDTETFQCQWHPDKPWYFNLILGK